MITDMVRGNQTLAEPKAERTVPYLKLCVSTLRSPFGDSNNH
jgi:hypothetical protein